MCDIIRYIDIIYLKMRLSKNNCSIQINFMIIWFFPFIFGCLIKISIEISCEENNNRFKK